MMSKPYMSSSLYIKKMSNVGLDDLPPALRRASMPPPPPASDLLPASGIDLRSAITDFENAMILQALDRTGGNRNRAAQLLGLHRTTLVEMLKRKGFRRGEGQVSASPR